MINDDVEWVYISSILMENIPNMSSAEAEYMDNSIQNVAFMPLMCPSSISLLQGDDDRLRDFIYWRRFGLIAFNVSGRGTSHQCIMYILYIVENMIKHGIIDALEGFDMIENEFNNWDASSKAADQFIDNSMGCYMSSATITAGIISGENFIYTPEEKQAFRGFIRKYI